MTDEPEPPLMGPAEIALEELLAKLRRLSAVMLDLEMYERWGNGSDPAFEARALKAIPERSAVYAQLTDQITHTRQTQPDAVISWAEAHQRLLEHFVTHIAEPGSTGASVANGEIRAWAEVAAGTRPFVRGNTVYVHLDRDRYRAYFGFEP